MRNKKFKSKLCSMLVAGFITCFSMNAIAQANEDCIRNTDLNLYDWKVEPYGNGFYNGQVIASALTNTTFYYSGYERKASVDAGGVNGGEHPYNAIPMPKTPGVGVRVSWNGFYSLYAFTASSVRPNGTPVSVPYLGKMLTGEGPRSYTISYYFKYEIVVIDAEKYKGGKLEVTNEQAVTAFVSRTSSAGRNTICVNGILDLMAPLVKGGGIPEMPKPPAPTCSSADLNRVVSMPPITLSQLAAYGSSRSEGRIAEQNFELVGRGCPAGTTIKAFFTDTRASSEPKNYLRSSHPSVGVRLYHRDSQQPIGFGPAPVGSTLPDRPPVVEGPTSSSLSDMYLPITAQYVQLPNVQSGAVTPGSLQAEAVVTFMYD
ncbi:fimbrial protein [Alcaligenes nematophilus]|uniref:fimbrial protein n=1 Tax=Alcaligenes nematophilus TaxID=2994643 RepID=UPI00384CE923